MTALEKFFIDLQNELIGEIPLHRLDAIKNGIYKEALELEREQHGNTWDNAILSHNDRGHVYERSLFDFDDYKIQ